MIKFCNTCVHSGFYREHELRCFNPIVNKNDVWALSNIKGEGYGSTCSSQRDTHSYFWSNRCGIQGKHWKLKVEKSAE